MKSFVLSFVVLSLLASAFSASLDAQSTALPDVLPSFISFSSGSSPFSSGIAAAAAPSPKGTAHMPTVISRRASQPASASKPSISGFVTLRTSDLRPLGGVLNEIAAQPMEDYRLLLSPQPVANWFIGGLKKDSSRLGALSCGNLSASDASAFAFQFGFRTVLVNGTPIDANGARSERYITHYVMVFSDESAASRAFAAWNASVAAKASECWTAWPDKKTKAVIATKAVGISLSAHGDASHAFAFQYQNRYAEGNKPWTVRAVAFRQGKVLHVIRLAGASAGTNDAQLDAYAAAVEKKGAA